MSDRVKIVTFVPLDSADIVRDSLGTAGAGKIGEYSFCSFSLIGNGRFKPSDLANPHIGRPGELETVQEERIEVVCNRSSAREIIAAMKQVHPYEEVAFDIYPLISEENL